MAGKRWTKEQLEYVNNWYGKKRAQEIADAIGRTKSSVMTKAREIGLDGRADVWSDEEVAFLEENYLKIGAEAVAEKLGRTVSAVHGKVRQVGCGRNPIGPRVDWTEEDDQFMRENYQKLSIGELVEHLGRTKGAIYARSNYLGIERYVDPYPFFAEWTEESAYVIGFFAADGWASKRGPESIRIGFCQKDHDILYALQDMIGAGRVSIKSSGMGHYYIQSVKVYERLCEVFGNDVCKKSHTLQWPNIPDGFTKHFLRGAVDGDGSFFKRQDGLWEFAYATSSFDFALELSVALEDGVGVKTSTVQNKIGVWHTRCVGIKAVCIADWLYRDAKIALERKTWIAREMMQTHGQCKESSLTQKMCGMFPHILENYRII